MMGSSGLIGFLQFKGVWKRKATPGLREQFWEACRPLLRYEDMCQRYRADGRYFVRSSVRTTSCSLATDVTRAQYLATVVMNRGGWH